MSQNTTEESFNMFFEFPCEEINNLFQHSDSFEATNFSKGSMLRASKMIRKKTRTSKTGSQKRKTPRTLNLQISFLTNQLIDCLNSSSHLINSQNKENLENLAKLTSQIISEKPYEEHHEQPIELPGFYTPTIRTNDLAIEELILNSDPNEGRAHSLDMENVRSSDPAELFITYDSEPRFSPEESIEDSEEGPTLEEDEDFAKGDEDPIKDPSDVSQWKASEYLKRGKPKNQAEAKYHDILKQILSVYESYRGTSEIFEQIETAVQKRYIPQVMSLFGNSVLEGYYSEFEALMKTNKPLYDQIRDFIRDKIKGKKEKVNKQGKAVKDARITKIDQMKRLFKDTHTLNQYLKRLFIEFFQSERLIWLQAILNLSHAKPEGKVWFILNKFSIEKVCFDEMGRGDFDPVYLPLDVSEKERFQQKKHEFFSQLINSLTF